MPIHFIANNPMIIVLNRRIQIHTMHILLTSHGLHSYCTHLQMDKAGRSGLLGWKKRNELDQDFWQAALEVSIPFHYMSA